MAASVQLAKLCYAHEAIIDWLLTNPDKDYKDCAFHFNYSISWLSIVVNSDAFKAEYERRRSLLTNRINDGIQQQLSETTLKALRKVSEKLDDGELEPEFALNTADKLLGRAGYGSTGRPVSALFSQQNNFFTGAASPAILADARERMRLSQRTQEALPPPPPALDGNTQLSVNGTDTTTVQE